MDPLYLHGCRHDILGHYLKAIGLLRVLAKCADEVHRDSDAEGWWDTDKACFCLRSPKYPSLEKLAEFFEHSYQPTPLFSPWNTGGGLEDKQEAVIRFVASVADRKGIAKLVKPKEEDVSNLISFVFRNRKQLNASGLDVRKLVQKVRKKLPGKGEITFTPRAGISIQALPRHRRVSLEVRQKTSGKKAVMALIATQLQSQSAAMSAMDLGRRYFEQFQESARNELSLLEELRDKAPLRTVEALDSVFTTRTGSRAENNPLFLNRGMGEGGNDEMFRQFWVLFLLFAKAPKLQLCRMSLAGEAGDFELPSELGFPFFPDAVKAYNFGSGWIQSSFRFNPLDYVLAMEGAYALRGSVARKLGATSKRFAAFPFVFETGEALMDGNDIKRTASALWLPVWRQQTSYEELASFISDSQARLRGKEVRFPAEFVRALRAQGVDAGFDGWQEFRFKLKIGRVPWVTSGSYLEAKFREDATLLNRALNSLDESRFLDQFEPFRDPKSKKLKRDGPHRYRDFLNAAMETAARETTPHHCLALLSAVFDACRQMAISESFRKTLPPEQRTHPRFFRPLPMEDWQALLEGLNQAEFRIARAVASMVGHMKQRDGKPSEVLPMLGSLLPLKLGHRQSWYLPQKPEAPSKQAVWTGTDVCHDLAAVLSRRYLDSLTDDRSALISSFGAPLRDVLAFLNGDLDDQLIARWIEGLSLIGWELVNTKDTPSAAVAESHAIPPEYAALRTLIELECEWREETDTKKRRSQQPVALLCQRSSATLPHAATEAVRWIAIWGVPNPYREQAKEGKDRLAGRDIISPSAFRPSTDAARLAAAVCVPLHWRDRIALCRAVSLPQAD
jgi:CRISPR-associated protein Csx17